jgi:uroporphyrinogen decarboxylase
MTSKERVRAAFAHEQPDHTPLDYFATPEIEAALRNHFGVADEDGVRTALGVDIHYVNPPYTGPELPEWDDGSEMNIWGVIKKPMANEYGDYKESVNSPYAGWERVAEAEKFDWPSPDWYDYDALPDLIAKFPGKSIFVGGFSIQDFINNISYGRGVEQVLIDIATHDPVYLYIVEKRHAFYMEHIERILTAGRGEIDAVLCGDDFGTQRGLLISQTSFDALFAQKKRELFELVHSFGAKVTHHSCGSTRDLIPRFIELGMDALQTIQPQAEGMSPYALKRDFAGRLVLHGGVDVQGWLQRATIDEIADEIRRLQRGVGAGGGYIMSPSHNMQPDTPIENVLAFYRSATADR